MGNDDRVASLVGALRNLHHVVSQGYVREHADRAWGAEYVGKVLSRAWDLIIANDPRDTPMLRVLRGQTAAAAPRWLTDARGRLAAAEPIRVGSDMHLLEMACDAYEEAERERGEERRGRHDLIRRYGGNLSGILDAAPAPAEALTLDRLLRTVAQVALWSYGSDELPAAMAAEDRAIKDSAALLTPRARLELAAELVAPLPPEERRRFAAGLLRGLPSRDGESALAQVLRVCGDVAVDEASLVPLPPGPHAAAVITGAEAAHEMLDPARVLALLAELVALLPSGPPGARLLLGVGAEAHAAVAALPGATRWVTPHIMGECFVQIPGARVRVGALVVEAQGEAQPVELPGAGS